MDLSEIDGTGTGVQIGDVCFVMRRHFDLMSSTPDLYFRRDRCFYIAAVMSRVDNSIFLGGLNYKPKDEDSEF